jgi:hypothetical protein
MFKKSNEYKISSKINGFSIKAKKTLPFELKLNSFKNKLTFKGQKVQSFVLNEYNYDQLKIV